MRNKNWIEFNNNNIKNGDMKDKVFASQPRKIKIHKVDKMWGLGTPEDLNNFIQKMKFD